MTYRSFATAVLVLVAVPGMVHSQGQAETKTKTLDPAWLTWNADTKTVTFQLIAGVPAAQKENVRNVAFSAQGTELRMDADVRLSAVPGMEMMSGLGFARMTGVGPVSIVQPGTVGWRIRTIEVSGVPLAESIWGPQVRKATKRNDNVVPVPVGSWVKGVQVQPTGLRLY